MPCTNLHRAEAQVTPRSTPALSSNNNTKIQSAYTIRLGPKTRPPRVVIQRATSNASAPNARNAGTCPSPAPPAAPTAAAHGKGRLCDGRRTLQKVRRGGGSQLPTLPGSPEPTTMTSLSCGSAGACATVARCALALFRRTRRGARACANPVTYDDLTRLQSRLLFSVFVAPLPRQHPNAASTATTTATTTWAASAPPMKRTALWVGSCSARSRSHRPPQPPRLHLMRDGAPKPTMRCPTATPGRSPGPPSCPSPPRWRVMSADNAQVRNDVARRSAAIIADCAFRHGAWQYGGKTALVCG